MEQLEGICFSYDLAYFKQRLNDFASTFPQLENESDPRAQNLLLECEKLLPQLEQIESVATDENIKDLLSDPEFEKACFNVEYSAGVLRNDM